MNARRNVSTFSGICAPASHPSPKATFAGAERNAPVLFFLMSAVLPAADPGPMARLRDVQGDAGTPEEVFRMLTEKQPDGDGRLRYFTLRQTGRLWGLPARVFAQWFILTYPEVYEAARKARAEDMEHEVLEIADAQCEVEREDGTVYDPEVPRDKLRVDARLKLMPSLDRERYGNRVDHKHLHVVDLGERLRRANERVVEAEAVSVIEVVPAAQAERTELAPTKHAEVFI